MDEVPMSFDKTGNFTVDQKGNTYIRITTIGSEKCNFTIILCVIADSGKLPPIVIFKRKTIPKKFPKGILGDEKGWINQEMMQIWINEV